MRSLTPAEKQELMEALRTRRRNILLLQHAAPKDEHLLRLEATVEELMTWARGLPVADG